MSTPRRTVVGRDTCGFSDPREDNFTDLKLALNAHLMKTDCRYQQAVQAGKDRMARIKERNGTKPSPSGATE